MFKVGDVVKVVNGRRGDRYRVIEINPYGGMVLRNIRQTNIDMNFRTDGSDHLELDKVYQRRKKLEKIMDNIDSFNILEKAKEISNLHQKVLWMKHMETRKRKLQKICSKLVTL